ncbi:hypothetical protein [Polycladidibacter stylochi]|uniref:hypothetical protein n=1 Tax=Polycladidibacter stylochi TaxID=1807766 RepID=UPI0008339AEE|nr:hypothetical protein [Pseudovibrio stylochi]
MRKLIIIIVVIIVLVLATPVIYIFAAGAYQYLLSETLTRRYRYTIQVSVDGVLMSGSAVHQVTIESGPPVSFATGYTDVTFKGEALAIPIGDGQHIYALIIREAGRDPENEEVKIEVPDRNLIWDACHPKNASSNYRSQISVEALRNIQGPCAVPKQILPVFVWFEDETDPQSGRRVFVNDLGKYAGKKIDFISAKIELTNDPISKKIEKQLSIIQLLPQYRRSEDNYYSRYVNKNTLDDIFMDYFIY